MPKIVLLTVALFLAQGAHAQSAHSTPMPTGPYPETGTFCGFLTLCPNDLVTRDADG